MTQTKPVIIVGAGPVGLTAALLLQARKIPFTLYEAEPELLDDLRASTFHPPTLDMLDTLGVAAPLVAQGLVSPTWQIRMHPSGERAVFDLGVIADSTAHPYRLQCEQSKLCRIMLAMLRDKGADIRMGMKVEGVTQDADGVRLDLRDTEGVAAADEAGFLIAADGARSAVRSALGFPFEGKTYPETTILATTRFPFDEHLEGLSNVNYVWKEGGTFSLLHLPGLWRCSLYPDGEESIEDALEPASIERKLQEIVPIAGNHQVDEIRPYRIHMRIVDDYRSGRVMLAGDAAHLNSPSGGMGMNGGIHDAFELVATLEEVLNGASMDVLDRYTRRRRPIAEQEILNQADRNRARMQERDPARRRESLAALQRTAGDPDAAREHLLRSSMIAGLRKAAEIA
ncbi:FAD-dependent oxidoreductase [Parasphingopyxis lamellibrachiae]|uniref:3-(3-hydroxy-phenyl)propionate hydroxylase n=1 Tax=Parasphingopyxis lamellibrachiae TaxID=680125 RepID=A0A3D9FG89_9SPHN|nr:FAD-dependent monooxygenase [Parasphingopyxis lamellibrachiae]RED16783.1 3-(3-hydroxy-phenyl)propionate hydroxylase [Parasphingopyxis lamellibrachiae]